MNTHETKPLTLGELEAIARNLPPKADRNAEIKIEVSEYVIKIKRIDNDVLVLKRWRIDLHARTA